jgi:mono/diheme cytochrome c family protein
MRNRLPGWLLFIAGALAFPIVASLAGYVYVSTKSGGFSARAEPSAMETKIAAIARQAAIPRSAVDRKNPVSNSPEILAEAKAHWADHCAGCHGNDGAGKTPMGAQMYPPAPDMRAQATQQKNDGALFYVIENGVRLTGMPGWGAAVRTEKSEQDSWKLVYFIRSLPTMTQSEIQQMGKLNPKTDEEREEERQEEEFLNGGSAPVSDPHRHHH